MVSAQDLGWAMTPAAKRESRRSYGVVNATAGLPVRGMARVRPRLA